MSCPGPVSTRLIRIVHPLPQTTPSPSHHLFASKQVITKQDAQGKTTEPYEEALVEVPEEHVGQVVELLSARKGQMLEMSSGAAPLQSANVPHS